MRILVITNMYPGRNADYPYVGVFVEEQVKLLSRSATVDVEVIDGFRGPLWYLKGFLRAWRACMRGGHDVIHVHYGLTAAFLPFLPPSVRRRVVVTLHGGDILSAQGKSMQVAITRRVLGHAGVVIGVSDEIAVAARPHSRVVEVLPCGVDEDFFSPSPRPVAAGPVRIIFPGNPDRAVKNHPLFLSIVAAYQKRFGAVEVVVLHMMERDQVRDEMRRASALLLTSLSEGSPQVVKEALACDLAVLASDVGDVRQVLDGAAGTGIFRLDDEPGQIAGQLHECIAAARLSPGARRRRIHMTGLGNEHVRRRLVSIYARLAGVKCTPAPGGAR